jgi:hydroxyacylglutathione hydrolase
MSSCRFMLSVSAIAALNDNYIWALRRGDGPEAVVVDPGQAEPVMRWLQAQGLTLGAILVTHHHWDHTNGIRELRQRWPVDVYGPANESQPIEALSHPLRDGTHFHVNLLDADFVAMDIPGHTLGHIALRTDHLLFCGDTLFSAGCGRLFEGTASQMHDSLQRLAALAPDTRVYCGHEYTEANLAFSLAVEPGNETARQHLDTTRQARQAGKPSLPSTIGLERKINPFLRCGVATVAAAASAHCGRDLSDEVAVFAELRKWKDHFKPAVAGP